MKLLGLADEPRGSGKGFTEGPSLALILSQEVSAASDIKTYSSIRPQVLDSFSSHTWLSQGRGISELPDGSPAFCTAVLPAPQ